MDHASLIVDSAQRDGEPGRTKARVVVALGAVANECRPAIG